MSGLKRGYTNGEKIVEIIDGNVDLVLYNEDGSGTFYFYRFPSKQVLGQALTKATTVYGRKHVSKFLDDFGMDYDTLLAELLSTALNSNMRERYEM